MDAEMGRPKRSNEPTLTPTSKRSKTLLASGEYLTLDQARSLNKKMKEIKLLTERRPVSSDNVPRPKSNLAEKLDGLLAQVSNLVSEEALKQPLNIFLWGKASAGKSTVFNTLARSQLVNNKVGLAGANTVVCTCVRLLPSLGENRSAPADVKHLYFQTQDEISSACNVLKDEQIAPTDIPILLQAITSATDIHTADAETLARIIDAATRELHQLQLVTSNDDLLAAIGIHLNKFAQLKGSTAGSSESCKQELERMQIALVKYDQAELYTTGFNVEVRIWDTPGNDDLSCWTRARAAWLLQEQADAIFYVAKAERLMENFRPTLNGSEGRFAAESYPAVVFIANSLCYDELEVPAHLKHDSLLRREGAGRSQRDRPEPGRDVVAKLFNDAFGDLDFASALKGQDRASVMNEIQRNLFFFHNYKDRPQETLGWCSDVLPELTQVITHYHLWKTLSLSSTWASYMSKTFTKIELSSLLKKHPSFLATSEIMPKVKRFLTSRLLILPPRALWIPVIENFGEDIDNNQLGPEEAISAFVHRVREFYEKRTSMLLFFALQILIFEQTFPDNKQDELFAQFSEDNSLPSEPSGDLLEQLESPQKPHQHTKAVKLAFLSSKSRVSGLFTQWEDNARVAALKIPGNSGIDQEDTFLTSLEDVLFDSNLFVIPKASRKRGNKKQRTHAELVEELVAAATDLMDPATPIKQKVAEQPEFKKVKELGDDIKKLAQAVQHPLASQASKALITLQVDQKVMVPLQDPTRLDKAIESSPLTHSNAKKSREMLKMPSLQSNLTFDCVFNIHKATTPPQQFEAAISSETNVVYEVLPNALHRGAGVIVTIRGEPSGVSSGTHLHVQIHAEVLERLTKLFVAMRSGQKKHCIYPVFVPTKGRHGGPIEEFKPRAGRKPLKEPFAADFSMTAPVLEPEVETVVFVVCEGVAASGSAESTLYAEKVLRAKGILTEIPASDRGIGFARQMIVMLRKVLAQALQENPREDIAPFDFFFMIDDDLKSVRVYDKHLFLMRSCSLSYALVHLQKIMMSEIAEIDERKRYFDAITDPCDSIEEPIKDAAHAFFSKAFTERFFPNAQVSVVSRAMSEFTMLLRDHAQRLVERSDHTKSVFAKGECVSVPAYGQIGR
jgi:GTPase SAR1 family protein